MDEMLSLWDQEVKEGLLYVTIGKAVVQYAEQLKGTLLRDAMHDEAVSILAEIYRILQDQELDEILGEPSEPSRQAVPKKDVPPDAEIPDTEVQEAEEGIPAASADDAAPVPAQE